MTKKSNSLRLLAALSFLLFVLASGIDWLVHSEPYNHYAQQNLVNIDALKKNVHKKNYNPEAFVKERYASILNYLNETTDQDWRTRLIDDKRFLTRKERVHLLEVKRFLYTLNKLIYVFLLIALVLAISYFWYTAWSLSNLRDLLKTVCWALIIGFIVLSALSPIFLEMFTLLHQLIFTSGTWLFYQRELIIHLFPLNYFLWGYAIIAAYTLFWFLLLLGLYFLLGIHSQTAR